MCASGRGGIWVGWPQRVLVTGGLSRGKVGWPGSEGGVGSGLPAPTAFYLHRVASGDTGVSAPPPDCPHPACRTAPRTLPCTQQVLEMLPDWVNGG